MRKEIIVAALAFATAANAAPTHVGSVSSWNIWRNDDGSCAAAGTYDGDGRTLVLGFNPSSATLLIDKVDLEDGAQRNVEVRTAGKVWHTLFVGVSGGYAVMSNLNTDFLSALRTSPFINFKGLGGYELRGSAAAMKAAWECAVGGKAEAAQRGVRSLDL